MSESKLKTYIVGSIESNTLNEASTFTLNEASTFTLSEATTFTLSEASTTQSVLFFLCPKVNRFAAFVRYIEWTR